MVDTLDLGSSASRRESSSLSFRTKFKKADLEIDQLFLCLKLIVVELLLFSRPHKFDLAISLRFPVCFDAISWGRDTSKYLPLRLCQSPLKRSLEQRQTVPPLLRIQIRLID